MAARTKSKVTPKYKTQHKVKNGPGVRGVGQEAERHHDLVRRGRHRRLERAARPRAS